MGNVELCPALSTQCLSDLSEKDRAWDTHRAESDRIEALYRTAGLSNYGDRVHDCSRWLGFALEPQDSGELKLKLSEARFCRVRHCPVCQWRRSLMWRARFLAALPRVTATYPTHRWLFLTLTVKNCPIGELRSTLQHMNRSWERLSKRKVFPAIGYVRSTEITKSALDHCHPHFHCMLLVKSSYYTHGYIPQRVWTDLWQQSLRVDYIPIVNIKSVKPRNGDDDNLQLAKAVLETLKYGVKVQDLVADSDWLAQLTDQVRKTRAVSVGGVLRDFIKEEEPDDLIHPEGEQDLLESQGELWFSWQTLRKRYILDNK